MKLYETISIDDLLLNGAIFTKIQSLGAFEWLTQNLAKDIDNDYYLSHSSEKTITPYMEKVIQLEHDGKIASALSMLATTIVNRFADKWNKIHSALIESTYNPLENYDMKQKETPNITKGMNKKTGTDLTTSQNSSADTYGFNSSTPVPSAQASSSTNVVGDKDKNFEEATETETGTRELTRHGNIGVTTSQQMLESEIKLRSNYNFIETLMNDVDSIMCLLVY